MNISRLAACSAVVLAAFALAPPPTGASEEQTGKKKVLWNRLREPKVDAAVPAGDPAPPEAPVADPVVPEQVSPKAPPPAAAPAEKPERRKAERASSGNREVDRIVARLRAGPIGQDASAAPYLDLIGTGEASPAELNDFASYIARKGLIDDAYAIQRRAVDLDGKNSMLWLNLGTLERGAGRPGPAAKAYRRAIDLDKSNALAWYSLGVVQDNDNDYDASVESFRRALTLDPSLSDPKVNPQVVNNDRILVVQLMLGQQRTGTRSLPLQPMQVPVASAPPSPADKPDTVAGEPPSPAAPPPAGAAATTPPPAKK